MNSLERLEFLKKFDEKRSQEIAKEREKREKIPLYDRYNKVRLIYKYNYSTHKATFKTYNAVELASYTSVVYGHEYHKLYRIKEFFFGTYYLYYSYHDFSHGMFDHNISNFVSKIVSFEDGISDIAALQIKCYDDCKNIFQLYYNSNNFNNQEIDTLKKLEIRFLNIYHKSTNINDSNLSQNKIKNRKKIHNIENNFQRISLDVATNESRPGFPIQEDFHVIELDHYDIGQERKNNYFLYKVKNFFGSYDKFSYTYMFYCNRYNCPYNSYYVYKNISFEDGIILISAIQILSHDDCKKVFQKYYNSDYFTKDEIIKLKKIECAYMKIPDLKYNFCFVRMKNSGIFDFNQIEPSSVYDIPEYLKIL